MSFWDHVFQLVEIGSVRKAMEMDDSLRTIWVANRRLSSVFPSPWTRRCRDHSDLLGKAWFFRCPPPSQSRERTWPV